MTKHKAWNGADDTHLREHYPSQPTAVIAAHLDRSERHIRQRAYDLGIKKAPGAKTLRTGRHAGLDDLIQLLYADMPNEELSALLGMPAPDIASRASRLGLHKSPAVLSQTYSAALLRQGRRKGQFEAGGQPWNKGLRGYSVELGRSHFKDGHRPPTWVPVGTERLTGPTHEASRGPRYLKRKVAEPNHWALVHHLVWEQHNGPIPSGHVVVFHDGDTTNTSIQNLRCITRTNLACSNGSGTPVDLLPVWRLTRQLAQEISNHESGKL